MQEKLQAALQKLTDRWKGLERGQKIKIMAIAIIFLIVLGIAVFLALKPQMYKLVSNSDSLTLTNAKAVLDDAGIPSELTQNGTALQVKRQDVGNAKIALETNDVFTGKKFTYYDALEYSSMGTTDMIKNENLKKATQTELEEMIMKMKGVQGATVRLVIPGDSNFFLPDNTASASILLESNGQLESGQAEAIARLVQRSVKNLALENIEITDQNYNMLFSGVAIQGNGGLRTQMDAEMLMKAAIETQIKKAAEPIYDQTNTIFNLRFNWDKISEQSTRYTNPFDSESQAGFIDGESISKQTYQGTNPGGEVGLGANDQQTPTYQMGGADTSSATINEKEASYIYDVVEQIKEGQIGNVLLDDSSIAVIVYRYTNYSEDYMTQNNRLGGASWIDFKQNTHPTEFTFAGDDPFVTALKTGTGIRNLVVTGYDVPVFMDRMVTPIHVETIVMLVILGLLILMLAYFLLRRTQPDEVTEIEPELSVEDLLVSSQIDDRKETEMEKLRDIEFGIDSEVKRQIEKFVDEKPDAVAQLLRNWLNEDWE